jgi:predicted transglutaminase-like protease
MEMLIMAHPYSPFRKKMGDFKHSDAPDAKGKFKELSPSSLASWLIKTRSGNKQKIISSLNQQVVFNRGKNPSYASKMKTTMNIVRKRLDK